MADLKKDKATDILIIVGGEQIGKVEGFQPSVPHNAPPVQLSVPGVCMKKYELLKEDNIKVGRMRI